MVSLQKNPTDRHYRKQVIKVNIISIETNWYHIVLRKVYHHVYGVIAKKLT